METRKFLIRLILFAAIFTAQLGFTGQKETAVSLKTVLTNCNVIDCTGGKTMKDMTVVITGNTITEIKRGSHSISADEENVRVFDLKGAYVLPGLWNVHVHLADLLPDPNHILDGEPLSEAVIRAGMNAMDGLRRGFTGLRTVGERDYLDVTWRNTFRRGIFVGPRIFASGNPIAVTGGHGGSLSIQADGPNEIRKAVRENLKHRVNWIKIMETEMTTDEIKAAVETAHQRRRRVCAHSGEPTSRISVLNGVDCLEHGYRLTDETIQLMAEKDVFYVPTIICNLSDEYIKEREKRLAELGFATDEEVVKGRTLVAYADERSPEMALYQRKVLQKAIKAGVKVCTGSDSNPVGEIGILEIEQFVLSGVSEMDALIAATRNCADLCGVLDKLGTVEEGKLADLIVVAENPLKNISNLRKLKMVFKDGKEVNLTPPEGERSYWKFYF